jgi:hypothetical protein
MFYVGIATVGSVAGYHLLELVQDKPVVEA